MEQLFTDFNIADAQAWKARLEKDLKGVTFEQLSVIDRNGITIHPFYTNEDITTIKEPVTTQPDWSICTTIKVTDAKAANVQALTELNHGASGLCFNIGQDIDPSILLQDIELPYIYSCFVLNNNAVSFSEKLQQYIAAKGWNVSEMNLFLSYDFIGKYLQTGDWKDSQIADTKSFLSFMEKNVPAICVDATLFQNAGANTTYELASALAMVNEYLHLQEEGNKMGSLKKINVSLATDTSFFEQIAKLRAFRKLLPLIFEQYNISPAIHLHVETSNIYRSPFDSYSNLLRDTIAGMAAVIGGCDSLYIHPFNETLAASTDFSRRMSRNQQLIFKEESYLDKVADAAAGSYYLETLTEQLAQQAWSSFKEIEKDGGLLAAFEKGIIQSTIAQQTQHLVQEYKDGKRVLIGVNKFVNAKDEPIKSTDKHPGSKGLKQLLLSDEIL
ncbi:MAG: methylmalonyl-CoA mutase family protein [Taibaiella sp.]|jgi:methylmalonyl-CoA mutase